jgi:hypothetical protein
VPRIGTDASPPPSAERSSSVRPDQRTEGAGHTVPSQREPVPLRQAEAELLATSDLLDAQLRLRLRAYGEGYEAGYETGYYDGREDQAAELAEAWNRIARPVSRGAPLAEIERRRWSVRGETRTRHSYGQPAPGDYPGREAS